MVSFFFSKVVFCSCSFWYADEEGRSESKDSDSEKHITNPKKLYDFGTSKHTFSCLNLFRHFKQFVYLYESKSNSLT